jgi:hypothetical protein
MIEAPPNPSAAHVKPTTPQRSADGLWEWNGTQWIATQAPPGAQQVAQSTPFVQSPPQVPVKKKGHLVRNVGIVVGALLLVGIGGAIASSGSSNNNSTAGTTTASSPAVTSAATAKATAAATAQATVAATAQAPAGPVLTNPQKNAVKSAQSYLSFMAFSRLGLIDQLSSSAGEGYSVQDATVAVDSLNVDWNAQAVRSAKEYLKTMPFSCNGLIDQLSSAAGENFTVAQATYGAQQAGAC